MDSTAGSDQITAKVEQVPPKTEQDQKNTEVDGTENGADQDDNGLIQVESLCMNCHENGETRLLLLKIPFFRDILLESFECPHCHFKNNSVKAAGQIQEQGSKYILEVGVAEDMERQVIKSDSATFKLETLGIEMPKGEGQLTNVEGIVSKIVTHLQSEQPIRKVMDPDTFNALEQIIEKLNKMLKGEAYPFTISLDDPTGNSWIAPAPHDEGNKYRRSDYPRTHEQNEALGLSAGEETNNEPASVVDAGNPEDLDIVEGKVYNLPAECPGCSKNCVVNMQKVNIPNFKEVYVWSTVCDHCGYKTNEVKTGGAIPDRGSRITLEVKEVADLSRDILKSSSCVVSSPELELSIQPGTLGGRFTTVEGLLAQVREQLYGQVFETGEEDLAPGDSMVGSEKETWNRFFSRIDSAIEGDLKFTITLEDPLASSYVQNLHDPEPDPCLKIEEYTRTDEEDDELGLKDMKTEGYENEQAS